MGAKKVKHKRGAPWAAINARKKQLADRKAALEGQSSQPQMTHVMSKTQNIEDLADRDAGVLNHLPVKPPRSQKSKMRLYPFGTGMSTLVGVGMDVPSARADMTPTDKRLTAASGVISDRKLVNDQRYNNMPSDIADAFQREEQRRNGTFAPISFLGPNGQVVQGQQRVQGGLDLGPVGSYGPQQGNPYSSQYGPQYGHQYGPQYGQYSPQYGHQNGHPYAPQYAHQYGHQHGSQYAGHDGSQYPSQYGAYQAGNHHGSSNGCQPQSQPHQQYGSYSGYQQYGTWNAGQRARDYDTHYGGRSSSQDTQSNGGNHFSTPVQSPSSGYGAHGLPSSQSGIGSQQAYSAYLYGSHPFQTPQNYQNASTMGYQAPMGGGGMSAASAQMPQTPYNTFPTSSTAQTPIASSTLGSQIDGGAQFAYQPSFAPVAATTSYVRENPYGQANGQSQTTGHGNYNESSQANDESTQEVEDDAEEDDDDTVTGYPKGVSAPLVHKANSWKRTSADAPRDGCKTPVREYVLPRQPSWSPITPEMQKATVTPVTPVPTADNLTGWENLKDKGIWSPMASKATDDGTMTVASKRSIWSPITPERNVEKEKVSDTNENTLMDESV